MIGVVPLLKAFKIPQNKSREMVLTPHPTAKIRPNFWKLGTGIILFNSVSMGLSTVQISF